MEQQSELVVVHALLVAVLVAAAGEQQLELVVLHALLVAVFVAAAGVR